MPSDDPGNSRVLVVDDHRLFGEALAGRLLRLNCFDAVQVATTIEEAKVWIRAWSPDLVLLDYRIGDAVGLDLLPHLGPERAPVAILSSTVDPDAILAALKAGVQGWLVKHARVEELVMACDALLAGDTVISPRVLRPLLTRLLDASEAAPESGTFVDDLSPRELEVLRCLASGLDRAQVAQRLHLSPNTVRTHVQRLFKRADVHSTLALVAKARAAGVPTLDEVGRPPRPRTSSE